ncbi:MAG: M15 family metallopeptidase [Fermentimonas sp.]|jgi:hypothetical protein
MKNSCFTLLIFILIFAGCSGNGAKREVKEDTQPPQVEETPIEVVDTIIDADYTFLQAVEGSNAPSSIIRQLELIDVYYTSTDGLTHKGQILTNKLISEDIKYMFNYMQAQGFVVDKVIPIVRYGWNDSLSMEDNNTYSFCYRNITYSKHAKGMAIDINPRFNPLRYKLEDRPNMPAGAVLDTTVNGTLHPNHIIVKEFRAKGFRWGHTFTRYYDDHHFEKR